MSLLFAEDSASLIPEPLLDSASPHQMDHICFSKNKQAQSQSCSLASHRPMALCSLMRASSSFPQKTQRNETGTVPTCTPGETVTVYCSAECRRGPPPPPRVPRRPTFSAWLKVPGAGEVPGLRAEPPQLLWNSGWCVTIGLIQPGLALLQ